MRQPASPERLDEPSAEFANDLTTPDDVKTLDDQGSSPSPDNPASSGTPRDEGIPNPVSVSGSAGIPGTAGIQDLAPVSANTGTSSSTALSSVPPLSSYPLSSDSALSEGTGISHEAGSGRTPRAAGNRRWRLISQFAAASVLATGISQVVFVGSYWATGLSTLATVLGWLAGAIPNFTLNRRSWGAGRHGLHNEIVRFGAISITTALLATAATGGAETLAATTFPDARPARIIIVWGAFLGTYAAMFVVKFFLIDRLVFTARPQQQAG